LLVACLKRHAPGPHAPIPSSDAWAVAPKRRAQALYLCKGRRRRQSNCGMIGCAGKSCLRRSKPGARLNPMRKADINGSARV